MVTDWLLVPFHVAVYVVWIDGLTA